MRFTECFVGVCVCVALSITESWLLICHPSVCLCWSSGSKCRAHIKHFYVLYYECHVNGDISDIFKICYSEMGAMMIRRD